MLLWFQLRSVLKMKRATSSVQFDPTRVTQLSRHPGYKLEKSMVVDNESGQSTESEVRTSSGMFLDMAQHVLVLDLQTLTRDPFVSRMKDEVVADIEERTATWTFLPVGVPSSSERRGNEMRVKTEDTEEAKRGIWLAAGAPSRNPGSPRAGWSPYCHCTDVTLRVVGKCVSNSEGKLAQSKDESWSDCARKGYEDIMITLGDFRARNGPQQSGSMSSPLITRRATPEIVSMRTRTALPRLYPVSVKGTQFTWRVPKSITGTVGRVVRYVPPRKLFLKQSPAFLKNDG
ncbi:hypothetical protein F3Y22_tig00111239pilonHSYRG00069 [Hibiscus syriacus]|uniref:Uncharacterized protein n=1 Tax=Hibiscus syriacus TaxID=106335 RepID=A0A6A2YSZ1_HIBSY|nr:hypothetical protein F3Y22_tig00111239pilonHSYRG00069 [Hibiscus syriacus]